MSMITEFVEKLRIYASEYNELPYGREVEGTGDLLKEAADIIEELSAKVSSVNMERSEQYYSGGWIPCEERLPETETEVLILANRKYTGGKILPIITTAIYEDGTVLENDSIWNWEDIDGEYSEEEDCYIIPEGWWEYRHYNADEVYNNAIDDKIIAWQPLPQPYKGE